MPKINKNTDLKPLNEYFIGKGTMEIIPLPYLDIPKDGTELGDLPIHWYKKHTKSSLVLNVECNPEGICPICEMLKPKTRWQKLKTRISKLWKQWKL